MENKNINKESKSYKIGFIIGGFIGKLFKPVYKAFKKWVI